MDKGSHTERPEKLELVRELLIFEDNLNEAKFQKKLFKIQLICSPLQFARPVLSKLNEVFLDR